MGASPGLTGKAEAAGPVFRFPSFPAGPTGAPRVRLVTEAGTRTGLWGESDPDKAQKGRSGRGLLIIGLTSADDSTGTRKRHGGIGPE